MWYIQDTVVCTVQVSFTRFIYEFYDSRVLEGGLPLAAVAFSPLHSAKDLPRTQAVLNREKWIFWSERISTSNPFSFATVFSRRGDLWGTHIECITRETISPWRVTRVLSNKLANRNSGGGATTLKTSLIPLFPRSGEEEIYWELFGTRYKKYRTSYLSVEWKRCRKEIFVSSLGAILREVYIFLIKESARIEIDFFEKCNRDESVRW